MSGRPGVDLPRVLEDLGATLLQLVREPVAQPKDAGARAISSVFIHDPIDPELVASGALVLGVGVVGETEIAQLLRKVGEQGAVGLVVRAPAPLGSEVCRAVEETGAALLEFTRGASWVQLSVTLRALLADGEIGAAAPDTLGGLPAGDLFTVANAVAALIDAPITIEDRNSRVIAFSGRQDEADESRVETILGRQVPERYSRLFAERGVFDELYRTDQPVFIERLPLPGATMGRVAIAVRAGDEVLGSLWAAVHEALSPERHQAFCEAAELVALHLLRQRAGADVERRLRADLVASALEGGTGAHLALERLGLTDQQIVVLALTHAGVAEERSASGSADLVHERQRLGDAFSTHLCAVVRPSSAVAVLGDVVYGLVPLTHQDESYLVGVATDFLDRLGDRGYDARIGVSPIAQDVASLTRARIIADRVARVLRERRDGLRVALQSDVYADSLMLELRDLVTSRGDQPIGAIARLLDYDSAHGTQLVETLRAWLDNFGDAVAGAASVHVHPNTFRYRVRRIVAVGQIDLEDPEARFGAMLQLRAVVSRPARLAQRTKP